MGKLQVLLITGRSIEQGCERELGKFTEEYRDSVAVCEMNPEDMKKIGVREGDNVKVSTDLGSVVLRAKKSRGNRQPGTVFIPYGPWSNVIIASETGATGMPLFKGVKAEIKPTKEQVLNLQDLFINLYRKGKKP